jgi:hypothetical protein
MYCYYEDQWWIISSYVMSNDDARYFRAVYPMSQVEIISITNPNYSQFVAVGLLTFDWAVPSETEPEN